MTLVWEAGTTSKTFQIVLSVQEVRRFLYKNSKHEFISDYSIIYETLQKTACRVSNDRVFFRKLDLSFLKLSSLKAGFYFNSNVSKLLRAEARILCH